MCATAADAAGLLDGGPTARARTSPIIDIRMPPTYTHEGAAAAVELREELPDLGILLLSQAVETHFASQLLERHAERFGYLLKDRVHRRTDADATRCARSPPAARCWTRRSSGT